MIAAWRGTSAIHQQGALRAQRAQLPLEKVSVGDRQWQAVENKWGKATILMLSIGADVCRTAGNDLLAFKNNWETEVSESRTDFAEPCPSPLPPRNTHTSTQAPEQHGSPGPGRWVQYPLLPLLGPPHSYPQRASSVNVFLSLPPGWLLPPHLASDPLLPLSSRLLLHVCRDVDECLLALG